MPLRKYRSVPEPKDNARVAPRLAADHDGFVASPVHAMQDDLAGNSLSWPEAPAQTDDQVAPTITLYPGWFRLGFPVAASGGLWVLILWAVEYLR